MTLKLIKGGGKPLPYKAKGEQPGLWTCVVCLQETGIATSCIVNIIQDPFERKGKIEGGQKMQICLHCLLRGKVTRV